jgi:hypothetical protein
MFLAQLAFLLGLKYGPASDQKEAYEYRLKSWLAFHAFFVPNRNVIWCDLVIFLKGQGIKGHAVNIGHEVLRPFIAGLLQF